MKIDIENSKIELCGQEIDIIFLQPIWNISEYDVENIKNSVIYCQKQLPNKPIDKDKIEYLERIERLFSPRGFYENSPIKIDAVTCYDCQIHPELLAKIGMRKPDYSGIINDIKILASTKYPDWPNIKISLSAQFLNEKYKIHVRKIAHDIKSIKTIANIGTISTAALIDEQSDGHCSYRIHFPPKMMQTIGADGEDAERRIVLLNALINVFEANYYS